MPEKAEDAFRQQDGGEGEPQGDPSAENSGGDPGRGPRMRRLPSGSLDPWPETGMRSRKADFADRCQEGHSGRKYIPGRPGVSIREAPSFGLGAIKKGGFRPRRPGKRKPPAYGNKGDAPSVSRALTF